MVGPERGRSCGTGSLNATPVRVDFSSKITDNILRAGINYTFGGPIVAKY